MLSLLKNRHKGERVILVCNGDSSSRPFLRKIIKSDFDLFKKSKYFLF
jgi:hypothetical protein